MSHKRSVEIFTAGCTCCDEAVALVKSIACGSCEITVHDMKQENVAKRAKELGVKRVPVSLSMGHSLRAAEEESMNKHCAVLA